MGAGGPSISVNFSPVIQITGAGAVREDVQSGLRAGVADLRRELERLLNSERRLSYVQNDSGRHMGYCRQETAGERNVHVRLNPGESGLSGICHFPGRG